MLSIKPARLRCIASIVLLAAALAAAAAAEPWQAQDLKTSISLSPGAAASLKLRIANVKDAAAPFEHQATSVSGGRDLVFESLGPLSLAAEIEGHLFTRLAGGAIVHRGGFDLVYPGGVLSLQNFVLAAGREPRTFELRTATGELVFKADFAHFAIDAKRARLQVFNLDLRLSAAFAKRLGEPWLEGMAVGVLALEARLIAPAAASVPLAGVPACGDWSGDKDVALINISSINQVERDEPNGKVSISPAAALKNVGTGNVPWYTKFSGSFPPYNNAQHPFLVWSLYRIAGGLIEQLGVSDVKHAFLTINNNCSPGACTDNNILGIGCEDIYSHGTNTNSSNLSYRDEITAHTGEWQQQGSHFDQNGDNVQDHPPDNPDPFMAHRLAVNESDLSTAGATYYFEAWYVVRDDINIFNSMGWRRVTPSLPVDTWIFTTSSVLQQGSAVNAWVNPNSPGAGNANTMLDTGEGHLRLAVKTTDLGGGQWRYDYALVNHDYDRQVGSFSIPLGGAIATAAYFRDLDASGANDWQVAVSPTAITWTKVDPVGLDWGVLFNFGFVSNAAPAAFAATLTPVEAGDPAALSIGTLAPEGFNLLFADGFESGDAGAWS